MIHRRKGESQHHADTRAIKRALNAVCLHNAKTFKEVAHAAWLTRGELRHLRDRNVSFSYVLETIVSFNRAERARVGRSAPKLRPWTGLRRHA